MKKNIKKISLLTLLLIPIGVATIIPLTSCNIHKKDQLADDTSNNDVGSDNNTNNNENTSNSNDIQEISNIFKELNWDINTLYNFKNYIMIKNNNIGFYKEFLNEYLVDILNKNIKKMLYDDPENFFYNFLLKNTDNIYYSNQKNKSLIIETLKKILINPDKNVIHPNMESFIHTLTNAPESSWNWKWFILYTNRDENIPEDIAKENNNLTLQIIMDKNYLSISPKMIKDENNNIIGIKLDQINSQINFFEFGKMRSSNDNTLTRYMRTDKPFTVDLNQIGINENQIFLKFLIKKFIEEYKTGNYIYDSYDLDLLNKNQAEDIFANLNWNVEKINKFNNFVNNNKFNHQMVSKFIQNEILNKPNILKKIEHFILKNLYSNNFANKPIYTNFFAYNHSPIFEISNNVINLFREYLNFEKLNLDDLSKNVLTVNIKKFLEIFIKSSNGEKWPKHNLITFDPKKDDTIKQEYIDRFGNAINYIEIESNHNKKLVEINIQQIDANDISKGFYVSGLEIFHTYNRYLKEVNKEISYSKTTNMNYLNIGLNIDQMLLKFLITEFENSLKN